MSTVDELSKQLVKEKLTSKFFAESERAALQALENVTQELKAVRNDLNARVSMQTELQQNLGIASANISNLHQQCLLLQAELGDRVKELTSVKCEASDAVKAHEKAMSKAKSDVKQMEANMKLLQSQVTVLSECIKGNDDPLVAALPEKLAQQIDAQWWKQKAVAAEEEAAGLKKELENMRFLLKEERMESQRANVLLVCNQRMVEYLGGNGRNANNGSGGGVSWGHVACSKEEQENLVRLQEVVATLTASQVSEIVKDNAAIRRDSERLQKELQASSKLAAEYASEAVALKKNVEELSKKEKAAASALTQQKANQLLVDREEKMKMLEQGSVASILMTFFTAPTRCPHCRCGLSDSLGLDLLAEAAGCGSVDELVDLMVLSVSEKISKIYQEAFIDHVAAITPPVSLPMAAQLVGPIPPGLMFFPPAHFARFLDATQFVSEAQAYCLAVQFMTVGARMTCVQGVVDDIVDKIRFLWLSTALMESEISRLENEILSCGAGAKQSQYLALMVPRSLLARLTQALRVRSTVLQLGAASGERPRTVFDDNAHPVVQELRRLRRSYVFLPKVVRGVDGTLPEIRELSIDVLLQLQPLCV